MGKCYRDLEPMDVPLRRNLDPGESMKKTLSVTLHISRPRLLLCYNTPIHHESRSFLNLSNVKNWHIRPKTPEKFPQDTSNQLGHG